MKFNRYTAFLGLILLVNLSCKQAPKLFQLVPSEHSGIHFNNEIIETKEMNPIDVTNIYNGGGVGIGDFNNDGLQDIYFTGNMVSNKLYLNKGGLQFDDITMSAGVGAEDEWCRGVAVVDINNDGWLDMYVSVSMDKNAEKRKNLLYINQGLDDNGLPFFKEMAAAYGLADTSHSTMAAFFDYDNDGDLDMYLLVNEILPNVNPSTFRAKITDGSFPSTGRLYRNNGNGAAQHPVFTDVTREAGLTIEGYGHGVNIADINKDGWKDIFVANDFIANDLLYINNGDGTFTDKASSYFKHTSANGMGVDVIDINNDGLSDVIELDMNPQDNYRKKMMLNSSSYQTFQLNDFFKYQYQYVRNSLQVNQGPRVNLNDSIGDPIFSDVGYLAGIAETDWSWSPIVADFDNDGLRDLVVTNGFPKDITDRDFITYRQENSPIASEAATLAQIPQVKLHNYAFQNLGNSRFNAVSKEWGLSEISFSNGGVYVDLDNDGDLDLVVNNINDKASVHENTTMNIARKNNKNYLSVQLIGDSLNVNGLGTWIELYYGGQQQAYEQTPYRGYLSTVPLNPHFGLDTLSLVDSLVVKWPDGSKQVLEKVAANQTVKVAKKDAEDRYTWDRSVLAQHTLFKEVTNVLGIGYTHSQQDYVDFNIQKLLPHKFSEYGPSLAAGDLNGDGLDDLIVGGNSSFGTRILFQTTDESFVERTLFEPLEIRDVHFQDMGILLFDADGDGDLDIYVARGGYESKANTAAYQDELFINDGFGNFTVAQGAIPENFASKSVVRAIDFDLDGDLDLFVAGRVEPWSYPKPVSSYVYRNDSKDGKIKFTDVTEQAANDLQAIGLVSDALFTDFDNDGWPDLILVGEWMPITFLKNEKGVFKNITPTTGLSEQIGWWTSIAAGDFDADGDMDYIVGNLGENSFYKASEKHPVSIYAKDFDRNDSFDAFLSLYLPTSQDDLTLREYPAHTRDDMIKQMIGMRSLFQNYKSFAVANMDQVFTEDQLKAAFIQRANNLSSVYIRNDGNHQFTVMPLPSQAQFSALNGMTVDDFDGDGNLDVIMNTNDYGTDVTIGRYNALNGLLLKGNGMGEFAPQTILESGIFIPGNGKALVKLRSKNGKYLLAAGQNRGPLKVFELKRAVNGIPLLPDEVHAELLMKNGKKRKEEFFYGTSFLSQSTRVLTIDEQVSSVTISNGIGKTRKITF